MSLEYDVLFRMCVKVLGNDTSLWEDEVYNFAKNHQVQVIIAVSWNKKWG